MLLLRPAVNYSSRLSPPPFPSAISPQSCTADHWKVLILKFTQTPNMLGTIVLVFMLQQSHFMQKSHKHHIVHSTHTKSTKRIRLLWGAAFFLNKTTYIHHNINISATGSTHLKSGPTLREKLTGGVNSIPFWQEGHSCKLWKCAQYTHKTYETKQHWKTANMHHNINMFTTGNTHIKYRKHPVHSAAHKLKIRSSRLVLTTAGSDLDSTDRAAMWGS